MEKWIFSLGLNTIGKVVAHHLSRFLYLIQLLGTLLIGNCLQWSKWPSKECLPLHLHLSLIALLVCYHSTCFRIPKLCTFVDLNPFALTPKGILLFRISSIFNSRCTLNLKAMKIKGANQLKLLSSKWENFPTYTETQATREIRNSFIHLPPSRRVESDLLF